MIHSTSFLSKTILFINDDIVQIDQVVKEGIKPKVI